MTRCCILGEASEGKRGPSGQKCQNAKVHLVPRSLGVSSAGDNSFFREGFVTRFPPKLGAA